MIYSRLLDKHADYPRMSLMVRNLDRLDAEELQCIRAQSRQLLKDLDGLYLCSRVREGARAANPFVTLN